jgi:hypothetical protein
MGTDDGAPSDGAMYKPTPAGPLWDSDARGERQKPCRRCPKEESTAPHCSPAQRQILWRHRGANGRQ